jgi:hypothetical protein
VKSAAGLRVVAPPDEGIAFSMHPIIRTIRTIVPPVLVGLQALVLISCEPINPLAVQQPSMSADSLRPSAYTSIYGVHFVTITTTDSSLVTGQQVQATGIPRDYYGNPIMQAPVTWSISPTNVATISATGLITGGSTSGTATVYATADGQTRSMTITNTAKSTTSAPVHMVSITANATQLKVGQSTQVSGVVRDINGTPIPNVPITWKASPTTVATATTTSATTGMVTAKGAGTATVYAYADTVVRQITITVTDTATTSGSTAPVAPGASGASYGSATPAALPQASVTTTYPSMSRQVKVPAGANLQTYLNNAQPGDELLLAPGATFTGQFYLPNKGSSSQWIVIRTDVPDVTIGAPGTRMTPTRAASANLAKIMGNSMYGAMQTNLGANHYRFTGVEIGSAVTGDVNAIVRFGDATSAQNTTASIANNIVLDRVYIHASSSQSVRRCVLLNSATTAVIDSWLSECHSNYGDSQAIAGWNGPGPFLIQNNHLEAGHEVVLFGGGSATIQNQSPSDVTVRGNHIMRPASWKGVWQAKNLVEMKHVRRLLIEGNVIEGIWQDAQAGFAFVLKSENQNNDNPWTTTSDVTIRYNRIRNVGSVFNLAANPSGLPAIPAARFVITDNVVENVNVAPYNAEGRLFQFLPGLSDVVVMHNSMVSSNGDGTVVYDTPTITRLVMHSNILHHGNYGVKGAGTTEGTTSLARFSPGYLFTNNAMVAGGTAAGYPANNYFAAQLSNLGFANLSGGDYRISTSSAYINKGYDGRDIGADVNTVNSRTAGAIVPP